MQVRAFRCREISLASSQLLLLYIFILWSSSDAAVWWNARFQSGECVLYDNAAARIESDAARTSEKCSFKMRQRFHSLAHTKRERAATQKTYLRTQEKSKYLHFHHARSLFTTMPYIQKNINVDITKGLKSRCEIKIIQEKKTGMFQ